MESRDERAGRRVEAAVVDRSLAGRVGIGWVLGTRVVIDIRDPLPDEGLGEAVEWLGKTEQTPARNGARTANAGLGRSNVEWAATELAGLLEMSLQLRSETMGAFDPFASGRFDPGNVVLGWVIERAASLLESAGARNFRVSARGHTALRGFEAPGRPWRVRLGPVPGRRLALSGRAAVATSAPSTGRPPIIDPRNGRPLPRRGAAIVTGPDLALAAGYSIGLWVDAAEGIDWFQRLTGYEALLVLGGMHRCTPRFPLHERGVSNARWDSARHPPTVARDPIAVPSRPPLPMPPVGTTSGEIGRTERRDR